ncbi:winged helix-turn-helix domain-containing protein [Candidatus Woesearchaeota archaeon]|nr:winged helix-turn-helix domain-containing protein [Candidatus Woesearchaeota archaeon]
MTTNSFVLMSLKEDKVKKMTQVLNNDTCRKILDYLSNNERATATEISKKLGMAMSTVHYNLKQLKDNNLVTSDEYHYSEKGKEVVHYGLANKYIIIAPKEDKTVMDKLRNFLPITLFTAFTGGLIYLLESNWEKIMNLFPRQKMLSGSFQVTDMVMTTETDMLAEPAMRVMDATISEPTTGMIIAPWFLAGAAFTILIMIAYELSRKK